MNRYGTLLELVSDERPNVILEVGTWNAETAFRMCSMALERQPEVHYYGFDLWLTGHAGQDQSENNAKARVSIEVAKSKLMQLTRSASVEGKSFTFNLFEGDSKESFPGFLDWWRRYGPPGKPMVDFAFIDGGHSLETIRADLVNVQQVMRPGGLIVMDDWYAGVVDNYTDQWGCNNILMESGLAYEVIPGNDRLRDGGTVHLALLRVAEQADSCHLSLAGRGSPPSDLPG